MNSRIATNGLVTELASWWAVVLSTVDFVVEAFVVVMVVVVAVVVVVVTVVVVLVGVVLVGVVTVVVFSVVVVVADVGLGSQVSVVFAAVVVGVVVGVVALVLLLQLSQKSQLKIAKAHKTVLTSWQVPQRKLQA